MAYVTYSEGFRSGGFNGRATAPGNTGPYDPETVESWEIGAKFTMFDNRFQLNLPPSQWSTMISRKTS